MDERSTEKLVGANLILLALAALFMALYFIINIPLFVVVVVLLALFVISLIAGFSVLKGSE